MSDIFLYRKRKRKVQINITPLIDVLFLLLIFFMVTSTFVKNPGIEITLPKISKGVSFTKKDLYEIIVTKEQKVFIDSTEVAIDDLAASVKKIKQTAPSTGHIRLRSKNIDPSIKWKIDLFGDAIPLHEFYKN